MQVCQKILLHEYDCTLRGISMYQQVSFMPKIKKDYHQDTLFKPSLKVADRTRFQLC